MTGLIWLVIVAGWLAYLVPRLALHKGAGAVRGAERSGRFADSMHIIRRSRESYCRQVDPQLQVSTPLQREAVFFQVRRASRIAARRRRVGLIGSFLIATAGVLVAFLTPAPWWFAVAGFALLVGFVIISRISVHTVDAMLDARLAATYEDWSEATVRVGALDVAKTGADGAEISVELDAPVKPTMESLWEPLAVTPPTYVSKPLVPRSVRTIDLTAPEHQVHESKLPVIAQRPEPEQVGQDADVGQIREAELPKAVGE